MHKILFIGRENIARSAIAEAVFNDEVLKQGLEKKTLSRSVGIKKTFLTQPLPEDVCSFMRRRGYDVQSHRVSLLNLKELEEYKLFVCMDQSIFQVMENNLHPDLESHLKLLMYFSRTQEGLDIPEIDRKSPESLETTLKIIQESVKGLLSAIVAQLN